MLYCYKSLMSLFASPICQGPRNCFSTLVRYFMSGHTLTLFYDIQRELNNYDKLHELMTVVVQKGSSWNLVSFLNLLYYLFNQQYLMSMNIVNIRIPFITFKFMYVCTYIYTWLLYTCIRNI